MKKLFGLLLISSVLFGAGCGNKKKQSSAHQEQKEIVTQEIIQEERNTNKEDYSVEA